MGALEGTEQAGVGIVTGLRAVVVLKPSMNTCPAKEVVPPLKLYIHICWKPPAKDIVPDDRIVHAVVLAATLLPPGQLLIRVFPAAILLQQPPYCLLSKRIEKSLVQYPVLLSVKLATMFGDSPIIAVAVSMEKH